MRSPAHLVVAPLLFLLAAAPGCADARSDAASKREPVVGGPCEGCDAVFVGVPTTLTWSSRIAPADEPGEPLRIDGVVTDRQGRPAPGVIVYAYHTDDRGHYPRTDRAGNRAATRHGVLRGWALTDDQGRYRFETIRPAGYPETAIPAHVHLHVIEVGRCTYYIDDILFDDDPRLSAAERRHARGRGGNGIAMPRRDATGTWLVKRDISLGEGISDYPEPLR
jgi:protocatechuate 3,4-dioxygenase, beta subunit